MSLHSNSASRDVLNLYSIGNQTTYVVALDNAGGFSGAKLWRVETAAGDYCLRRWPTETSRSRVADIHRVLVQAENAGLGFIPAVQATVDGRTAVVQRQHVWELTRWLPGAATFHVAPNDRKLAAAMESLAMFHVAVSTDGITNNRSMETNEFKLPPILPSPGLHMRLATVRKWRDGDIDRLQSRLRQERESPLLARANELIQCFQRFSDPIERQLQTVAETPLAMQPCIRDVWHDHLLFSGDDVTGIVDFGAMRNDSVAGDLARLLGSLIGDDLERWQWALDRYQSIRPLSEVERRAVAVFDAANVLLSGLSWLRWIFFEHRIFTPFDPVLARIDEHLARLRRIPGHSDGTASR